MKRYVLLCFLFLASCKATVTNDNLDGGPGVDTKAIPNLPFGGFVDSEFKTFRGGYVVPTSQGDYRLTLVMNSSDMNCEKLVPEYPHLSAIIPASTGTYVYSSSNLSGILRPLTFSYFDKTSGASKNIMADISKIQITEFGATEVKGGAYAESKSGSTTFDLSGHFALMNCASPENKNFKVLRNGIQDFQIAYSEIVPVQVNGEWRYIFRAMDKVPKVKCNPWDAWMMTETPIKYVQTIIPQKEGQFQIPVGSLEIGFQGNSGGTTYENFVGSGRIVSIDRFTAVLTLQSKEMYGTGLETSGRMTTSICDKQ